MPRILSVADVPATQDRTCRLLQSVGYQTTAASDGAEALVQYRAQPPDGVLIEVSGFTVKPVPILHQLRQAHPQARIIVVHPGDADDAAALAEERAATALLLKPFDPTRWLRAVEALLNPHTTRRYTRVRTALTAQVAPGTIHADFTPCLIEDLTPEGAGCRLTGTAPSEGLEPGNVIRLLIDLPQGTIHAVARIVHRTTEERIGVFFLRLAPAAHSQLGCFYQEIVHHQGSGEHGTVADRRTQQRSVPLGS